MLKSATGAQNIEQLLEIYPHLLVLFKQGSNGSSLSQQGRKTLEMPAFSFDNYPGLDLVDTTGAGDAFTAGFALGLAEGLNDQECLTLATQTAFLTITRFGAGPAMPMRSKLNKVFG